MGDLSPHFSRHEFDSHDGAIAHPDPDLINALEKLRHLVGDKPLKIVSGYRSAAWNRHVGGANHSQHLFNRAADIPQGYATVEQARESGFTGVGVCDEFAVHVDVRPGPVFIVFEDC